MLLNYVTTMLEQHSVIELVLAGTIGLFLGSKFFGSTNYKGVFVKSILHKIYLVCTDPVDEKE